MEDSKFVSGDRVVDLAASLRSAALVSGGISCAVTLWIIKHNVLWSIAALVVGAIAGLCIGLILGPLLFPAPPGNVVVVKVGPGSLAATLKATLVGAVISGAIAAAVPAAIFEQLSTLTLRGGVGCVIGAAIGAILGYLASK